MPAVIHLEVQGKLAAKEQLQLLMLPEAKRRKLLRQVANKVNRDAKKRITAQTDLKGAKYPKRYKPRKDKRKMLVGLRARLAVVSVSGVEAKVGFKDGRTGAIALQQQDGAKQSVTAASLKRSNKNGGHLAQEGMMASDRQAEVLADELDAKFRRKGKGWKKQSKRWIKQNISMLQAGAIIRAMHGDGKKSWTTVLPARSFLGVLPDEAGLDPYTKELRQKIFEMCRAKGM